MNALKRVSVRAGVAVLALAGAFGPVGRSADAGTINIHIVGGDLFGLWIHIGTAQQSWSSLSPDLSSGHLDYMVSELDPVMGMNYALTDGTALTGADVTGVMGSVDVSGVGSPQMDMAGISIWVTWGKNGRSGGIHLIDLFGSALAFEGTSSEGQLMYGAHDLAIPVSFHETEDGVGDIGIGQFLVTDIEWTSDAALPAPGSAALLGLGFLMASRRRRD